MTMREKMARAGYEKAVRNSVVRFPNDGDILQMSFHSWENQSDALKADWLTVVDAQLDALREPTKAMYDAADGGGEYNTRWIWETMILAAREGKL